MGLGFDPHGILQSRLIPVLGNPKLSSGLCRYQACKSAIDFNNINNKAPRPVFNTVNMMWSLSFQKVDVSFQ